MAFGFLSKSKPDDDAPASDASSSVERDPRKAERFFEHAQTVAEARNYDYSIECYINGLKHSPDRMASHEALHEVGKRRKVTGGKPAGMIESMKSGGSHPIDRMLHAERLWAMDPMNIKLMRDVMKHAAEAEAQEAELHLGEVAFWVGTLILDQAPQQKKPDKGLYKQVAELFASVGRFDKAVDAMKLAVAADPTDADLRNRLKELEAENTMQKGGYGTGVKIEEGGFRKMVQNADAQKVLEQAQSGHGGGDTIRSVIDHRRGELEEDPEDTDKLQKLVEALNRSDEPKHEQEAIDLLTQAWERTGTYRFKVAAGDIRMRSLVRQVRAARAAAESGDKEAKAKYEAVQRERQTFELAEYQERAKHYPTDLALKFELGKRLYAIKQFDEAIGALQQAKQDPKSRVAANMFLGSAYMQQGWLDEAVSTLRVGLEAHPNADDKLGLELRYLLMDALAQQAKKNNDADAAKEAVSLASNILQTDISFRDIRHRLDALRTLASELEAG